MNTAPLRPLPYVATGVANTASVCAAFARLGRRLVPATVDDVSCAAALVVPGVGHFDTARRQLDALGLTEPLQDRLRSGAPTLGICLGMQLCCEGSDEAPATAGLGFVPGRCRGFAADVRSPQMGWNEVTAPASARMLESGHYYFANSYALHEPPEPPFLVARATHGRAFVAAVERGPILLCQFHPELSGAAGAGLLQRWLDTAARTAEATSC